MHDAFSRRQSGWVGDGMPLRGQALPRPGLRDGVNGREQLELTAHQDAQPRQVVLTVRHIDDGLDGGGQFIWAALEQPDARGSLVAEQVEQHSPVIGSGAVTGHAGEYPAGEFTSEGLGVLIVAETALFELEPHVVTPVGHVDQGGGSQRFQLCLGEIASETVWAGQALAAFHGEHCVSRGRC